MDELVTSAQAYKSTLTEAGTVAERIMDHLLGMVRDLGTFPPTLNWTDVAEIEETLNSLTTISDRIFHEGEHAYEDGPEIPPCGYCAHRAHPSDVCEVDLGEFGECSCADSGFLNGRASDSSDFPDHETVTRIGTSGQMEATDGCFVDTLDEYCEHGSPSWSRQLGLN